MELFKPTNAAVHGPCVGYGLTGVLFCDFVIAGTAATRVALVRFGFGALARGVPFQMAGDLLDVANTVIGFA